MARCNNARFKKGPLYEANRKKMEALSDQNFIDALKLDIESLKLQLKAEILKGDASVLSQIGTDLIETTGQLNNMHDTE